MVVPPQALSQFRVEGDGRHKPGESRIDRKIVDHPAPIGGGASQLLGALADVILKVDLISRPGARRR